MRHAMSKIEMVRLVCVYLALFVIIDHSNIHTAWSSQSTHRAQRQLLLQHIFYFTVLMVHTITTRDSINKTETCSLLPPRSCPPVCLLQWLKIYDMTNESLKEHVYSTYGCHMEYTCTGNRGTLLSNFRTAQMNDEPLISSK